MACSGTALLLTLLFQEKGNFQVIERERDVLVMIEDSFSPYLVFLNYCSMELVVISFCAKNKETRKNKKQDLITVSYKTCYHLQF
jgi:hypothetical protein